LPGVWGIGCDGALADGVDVRGGAVVDGRVVVPAAPVVAVTADPGFEAEGGGTTVNSGLTAERPWCPMAATAVMAPAASTTTTAVA
jgi:hypothetical protein